MKGFRHTGHSNSLAPEAVLRAAPRGGRPGPAVLPGAVPGVQPVAFEERGPADKALPALQARVGPLPAVDAAVLVEGEPAAEGLAALVRLVPRVDPAARARLGALPEGLAALAALEGPLLRVDQLVSQQDGALLEGLAALRALEGLGARVDDLVPEQQRVVLEGLAASTPVRSLPNGLRRARAWLFFLQGTQGYAKFPTGAACLGVAGSFIGLIFRTAIPLLREAPPNCAQ